MIAGVMRMVLLAAAVFAALASPAVAQAPPAAPAARQIRWVMGTALEISVVDDDPAKAAVAMGAAFDEAQRVDRLLSNYRPESELSLLNAASGRALRVSSDFHAYLRRARRDSERTAGAFDITVGPLVDLLRRRDPSPSDVARAHGLVGSKLLVFPDSTHAMLSKEGMSLDPGGDGKGYAIDAMVRVLRRQGITSAWIDFGRSSMYGLGAPQDRVAWTAALPSFDPSKVITIALRDCGLSVSAALVPEDENDPKPRAHIVDPRSGLPLREKRIAVALAPSATDAEVLTKAILLDGEVGFEYLKNFDRAEAALLLPDGTMASSPGFQRYVHPAP
ncbi:MAG TPA: FAD:protein FMN transferase [bacterium]|nr:FAD:protein FMN transferase [bacterium]